MFKPGIGLMRLDRKNFIEIQKVVDIAMNHGINYFESCMFYLDSQCEELLTKALQKYPRESYEICAKMAVHGILETRRDKNPDILFKKQLYEHNTEYFDYYLVQAVDRRAIPIMVESGLIPYLQIKRKEGVIKKLGFSFHDTPDVLEKVIKMADWDFVQLQLNYYDWFLSTGKKNYEICQKYGLPIHVMGALKGGLLTSDRIGLDTIYGYKFLNTLKNVELVLFGPDNSDILLKDIDIFHKDLSLYKKELALIKEAIKRYSKQEHIDCSGCGYCEEFCSRAIPVKEIFSLYNQILKNPRDEEILRKLIAIEKSDNSNFDCLDCGNCEKVCPQHLNIRKLLRENIFLMRM